MSRFENSLNMRDGGSKVSFFRDIHTSIDIFTSMRPITTKIGRQVHLDEFITDEVITIRSRDFG